MCTVHQYCRIVASARKTPSSASVHVMMRIRGGLVLMMGVLMMFLVSSLHAQVIIGSSPPSDKMWFADGYIDSSYIGMPTHGSIDPSNTSVRVPTSRRTRRHHQVLPGVVTEPGIINNATTDAVVDVLLSSTLPEPGRRARELLEIQCVHYL